MLVTLATVALGYMLADYAPLIPLLSPGLGIDSVGAGLLSTALAVTYVVGTLITTGLPDRFGPKRVIAAGLWIGVASAALIAVAPGYAVVLLGKALQGVASALTFIAGARYVAGLYRGKRSHLALGIYGAGYPLGSALALALMPRLAEVFNGWRGAFWGECALTAVIALLWSTAPPVAAVPRRGSMRDALRCRNCWLAALQHTGFGLTVACGAWITVFLLREFGLPLSVAGTLGALLLLTAMIARPLGGWLVASRRLRTRPAMALANALILAGVAVLALPDRPLVVALLAAVVVGIGGGLPYASVFNTAAASFPAAPAAAQGMLIVVGAIVILGVTPAMGFAAQTYGFWAAWSICGAFALIALAGTAFMRGEEALA